MLVGGANGGVRRRVLAVLGAAAGSLLAGVAAALAVGLAAGEWPPRPSGAIGVSLGAAAALIVFFEMLLWPRKLLRGKRLGATRTWLRWHVWVGFASLPVVLVHAGFGFGGPLPATTLGLFLLVYASGVWGLILQQWIPHKLLADLPAEAVTAETGRLAERLADEAERGVRGGRFAGDLTAFVNDQLLPYLRHGRGATFRGSGSAGREFDRLRRVLPPAAHPGLDRLRELADARRAYDAQRRLHGWLHGWLLVHLPLSVAMTGLMVLHAVRALKYW